MRGDNFVGITEERCLNESPSKKEGKSIEPGYI